MPSYEHKEISNRVAQLDTPPEDEIEYSKWVTASEHLKLLQENSNESKEVIICASGNDIHIDSVMISEDMISSLDQDDLLDILSRPSDARVAYVGEKSEIEIWDAEDKQGMQAPIFWRDGLEEREGIYFELLQEYAHLTRVYWQSERHAYCRINEVGELEEKVSITSREEGTGVSLVSFASDDLAQYLAASNAVLVRMFEFYFSKSANLWNGSSNDEPESVFEYDNLCYRQKVDPGYVSWARGVQVIRLSPLTDDNNPPVEFKVWDFRHDFSASPDNPQPRQFTIVSTDPSTTTNYFVAHQNNLPYDTSPAFFHAEVLSKYKSNREKYTVTASRVSCRGGWSLRYDLNDAGQVHTAIYHLRDIPHQEQVYWKSCNELPKAGFSEGALAELFEGRPFYYDDPLLNIKQTLCRWGEADYNWWNLGEYTWLESVNTPLTDSRDEWARAFADLSRLVVEGFQAGPIRAKLSAAGIEFNDERSLALIEKLLTDEQRLHGLRDVEKIRSKNAAHRRGSEAAQLAKDSLAQYGTYPAHFESVCRIVLDELDTIEKALL